MFHWFTYALVQVENANQNGDPANDNYPRTDRRGYALMSDVCIKRKIRNALMAMGENVLVQPDDLASDGFHSIESRAMAVDAVKNAASDDEKKKALCDAFIDVRLFGCVLTGAKTKDENGKVVKGTSVGVKGSVTTGTAAKSLDPVEVVDMQITKSTNGQEKDKDGRASDTMGHKRYTEYALIPVILTLDTFQAEKNGVTEEDLAKLEKAVRKMFEHDASAARPAGSMQVVKMVVWKDQNEENPADCQLGQIMNAVHIEKLTDRPESAEDYDIAGITVDDIPAMEKKIVA